LLFLVAFGNKEDFAKNLFGDLLVIGLIVVLFIMTKKKK
jgi:hypothetical protein